MYEILQLEISEAELIDPAAQTDHEILASGQFVLIRDIVKAKEGEPFMFYGPSGGLPIQAQGINPSDVNDYLTLFQRWKKFGLPHGRGWLDELPWVIDILYFLDGVYDSIQAWYIGKGSGSSPAPEEEAF